MSRFGSSSGPGIKAGPVAVILYLFSFIWLGIYTVALANNVATGGLGFGALGEMIPLLAGLPILFLSLTKKFNLGALGLGALGVFFLYGDALLFQNPLVSGQIVQALTTLSTSGGGLVYQTSKQSLVFTLGTFAVSEEGGFGMFSRTLLDGIFGVDPSQSGYVVKGIIPSIINGVFFDMWHLFVTVPAYSQLLAAPAPFGFNVAILLTPFSLSAIVARIILDSLNRASNDYAAGMIGHAGYDMSLTAHVLGFF